MRLRTLQKKDALHMLTWMHDEYVTKFMKTSFSEKTLEDCEQFIASAHNDEKNLHFAIAK